MGDRNSQNLASLGCCRPRSVRIFDTEIHVLAGEFEALVSYKRARKEVGLAKDLKSVADSQDESALFSVRYYRLHDRRESSDCAGSEVVAVGESAGKNQNIVA